MLLHINICNLGHSQSLKSHVHGGSKSIIQGILPFTAPEVFHTCKFTKKSDIYSFGIVMYLMGTGELPLEIGNLIVIYYAISWMD